MTHTDIFTMNNLKLFLLFVLTLFVFGCSVVQSVNKIGENVYTLNKDDWEGTWVAEEGALELKVINQELGEIQVMFIENEKLLKYKVLLTKNDDDNTYMNVIGETEEKHYHFAKFKKDNNQIIVWPASTEMLKEEILKKKISGNIVKDKYGETIIIDETKKELNTFFIHNKRQMLFEYEEPLILRRLTK